MKDLYNLKVAKVIDDYRVVINGGSEDGVKTGMSFVIYSPGEEIFDPDDRSSLGRLEITKGRILIEHVQEKFSTGKSATSRKVMIGSQSMTRLVALKEVDVGDLVKRVS